MKTNIELAEQAEAFADRDFKGEINWTEAYESKLIELVRADERDRAMRENAYVLAEREACARVLDEMADDMAREMEPSTAIAYVRSKAAAIRARGQA